MREEEMLYNTSQIMENIKTKTIKQYIEEMEEYEEIMGEISDNMEYNNKNDDEECANRINSLCHSEPYGGKQIL